MSAADTSGDEVLNDVSSFESLLKVVGTNGRWNTGLLLICAACAFVSPMQTLSYQFLGNTPDYWCHVDPLVQANWTAEEILSLAIPINENTNKSESCKMYGYNFTQIAHLGYEKSLSYADEIKTSSSISCPVRDFDLTLYQSTVVIEWDLVCDRRVLYSTTQAAAQIGKFVGYFVSGYLLDTLGRRPVILGCSVLTIASGFLSAASPNVEFYIFLKVVVTCMIAGVYLGCFVMAMENCSSEKRSMVGSMFVMPWALGYMVLPGIAYVIRTWQWLQAALTVPALFLIAYFWILPESPRWLILKGHHQEALKVLKKAAKLNKKTLPSDTAVLQAMERIGKVEVEDSGDSNQNESLLGRAKTVVLQYLALLRIRELRTRTLVVYFCWFAAAMVYYGVALNATNLSADPYMYVFLGGLLEVPSYLLLWPAVVHLGRTKSLVVLFFVCALSIVTVMLLQIFAPGVPVGLMMTLSLCGKMAITAAFHLAWMFTAELFPTKYRSLAVSQASVKARIGSICSPYINDVLGETFVWAPSALFSTVSLVAAGLSLLLPDTKGRDLPESNEFNLKDRRGNANVAYVSDTDKQNKNSP